MKNFSIRNEYFSTANWYRLVILANLFGLIGSISILVNGNFWIGGLLLAINIIVLVGYAFLLLMYVIERPQNSNNLPISLDKVNRVEVIDENGRSYVNWKPENKTQLSFQDDGRTLKIFISQKK